MGMPHPPGDAPARGLSGGAGAPGLRGDAATAETAEIGEEPAAVRLRTVADGVLALAGISGLRAMEEQDAVRRVIGLAERAFTAGTRRVEAEVRVDDRATRRVLQRAGLRPEGTARGRGETPAGESVDLLRLARLATDPAPGEPGAFLGMLNATLPRKRLIAQGLIRGEQGRILLCELTYKTDWDLPGGVVDPEESPRATLRRELREELGVDLPVGELLAVNWLPPYKQWEDALLLVFDVGTHPTLTDGVQLQPSEVLAVHWVDPAEVGSHVAPYVARHLDSLLSGDGIILEDGLRPSGGDAAVGRD